MTLTQIRDKANARLATLWPYLQAKQDAYFAKHGKYFSLHATQKSVDGADVTATVIHPHDELYPADVEVTFDSPLPFQLRVDEYVGPNGAGYSASVWIELLNGDIYYRTRTSTNEDSNWQQWIITI
jgi:hypothetical protein